MTHRLTIQYDAKLSFTVKLPEDDARLIRDQTPLSVVVEPADADEACSNFTLKIRVGDGDDARDYDQAKFVHRSAATGAASCLLQYLKTKQRLNVRDEVIGPFPLGLAAPDGQSFVAVGWRMSKRSRGKLVGAHAERMKHDESHKRRASRG